MLNSTPKPLVVAGVMSGTSADGIDVALCRISSAKGSPKVELLAHRSQAYPPEVREALLRAMSDAPTTVADLARLNWRLGELYAECVAQTCTDLKPDLIGLHGQTLYHQTTAGPFLGSATRATWQTGEPALLAERLRTPVVSDFRPADLAAGGQGAPLVPILDFHYFRSSTRNRILLNLGGIANITVLPANCTLAEVRAFDTGPANMVLDALMLQLYGRNFDCNGHTAARGSILPKTLVSLLEHPYFAAAPPKSCGREQFGLQYAAHVRELSQRESTRKPDTLATAAELTAQSILRAALPFVTPGTELIVSGGGTRNTHLMLRLRTLFNPIPIKITDDHGLPSEAKEAAAFALLAWLTWHRLPGNVPSATGATHPAILGRITCV